MTRTLANLTRRHALAAGLAASLSLPGTALASEDWTSVAPTCVPSSPQTLDFGLTSQTGGHVRAGRNPPVLYFCPIHHADTLSSKGEASWNTFKLQYVDTNLRGGNVIARLYRKHRTTGVVTQVAMLSSASGSGVQVVSRSIKPQNLKDHALYATFEMAPEIGEDYVETHMLMLTTQ